MQILRDRVAHVGTGGETRTWRTPFLSALPLLLAAGLLSACGGDPGSLSGTSMGDAGRMRPDSIGGTVWQDGDGDGTISDGETGTAGSEVSLWQDTDGDGVCDPADQQVATATTETDGSFLFEGLAAGSYCVQAGAGAAGTMSAVVVLAAGGSQVVNVPLP